MPKPRKLLTYEWVTYAPDMEMEEMLALAKSNGITVVSTAPTGQMTEYYTDDGDYGEAPEMEIVLHGQLPQFRKFYYADQDRRGDSAQSVESFDARELGIMPVR